MLTTQPQNTHRRTEPQGYPVRANLAKHRSARGIHSVTPQLSASACAPPHTSEHDAARRRDPDGHGPLQHASLRRREACPQQPRVFQSVRNRSEKKDEMTVKLGRPKDKKQIVAKKERNFEAKSAC